MLYTRKGDSGTTKLITTAQGVRVSKASAVFELLGTLDELNAILGLVRAHARDASEVVLHDRIVVVQQALFSIQAIVAGSAVSFSNEQVTWLEHETDRIEASLPEIKTFFLPGATVLSSLLDVARTVTRRAERALVTVRETEEGTVSDAVCSYLNRLSSFLYALVRLVNHQQGVDEISPHYNH